MKHANFEKFTSQTPEQLLETLYHFWRIDKTPIYNYSGKPEKDGDRFGRLPKRPGSRWATPREQIEGIFRAEGLDIWQYHREYNAKYHDKGGDE